MLIGSIIEVSYKQPFYYYRQPMVQALILAHQNEDLGLNIRALGVIVEISEEACRLARQEKQARQDSVVAPVQSLLPADIGRKF